MPTCSSVWDSHRARCFFLWIISICLFRRWWAEWLVLWGRVCPRIYCPQPSSQVGSWPPFWSGTDWLRPGQALRFHISLALTTSSKRWVPQGIRCFWSSAVMVRVNFTHRCCNVKCFWWSVFCNDVEKIPKNLSFRVPLFCLWFGFC